MAYLTDTVNYKGVRERYNVGTAAEYNEWLSDDNATDGFDNFEARDEALKRAEKEYNRRKKGKDQREGNSDRINSLEAQLARQNSGAADAAAQAEAQKQAQINQQNEMQAAQRLSAQQAYQQRVDEFEKPKNNIQEQIAAIKARSPFGGSFMDRIPGNGPDPRTINVRDPNQPAPNNQKPVDGAQQFADKYKLDLISSGATKGEKSVSAFLDGK